MNNLPATQNGGGALGLQQLWILVDVANHFYIFPFRQHPPFRAVIPTEARALLIPLNWGHTTRTLQVSNYITFKNLFPVLIEEAGALHQNDPGALSPCLSIGAAYPIY